MNWNDILIAGVIIITIIALIGFIKFLVGLIPRKPRLYFTGISKI